MHEDKQQSPVGVMSVVVGALALFAPIFVSIDPLWGNVEIWAMTWMYRAPYGFADFGYVQFMASIPFTVWRVVFVYQMNRYYRGRSTRRVTVLLGAFAEMPLLVLYCMIPLLAPPTALTWGPTLLVPTPLMLVAAFTFLWMTPFPVPKTPFDDQPEPDEWWQENSNQERESSKGIVKEE